MKKTYQKEKELENRLRIVLLLFRKPMDWKEIQEKTGFSSATIFAHIKELEKMNLISMIVDAEDKRRRYYAINYKSFVDFLDSLLNLNLTPTEKHELAKYFEEHKGFFEQKIDEKMVSKEMLEMKDLLVSALGTEEDYYIDLLVRLRMAGELGLALRKNPQLKDVLKKSPEVCVLLGQMKDIEKLPTSLLQKLTKIRLPPVMELAIKLVEVVGKHRLR